MKMTLKSQEMGFKNADEAFDNLLVTLRHSLKLWDYFVNWDKVIRNTRSLEIHLNVWNYLIGKEDFDNEFHTLLTEHPEIVLALPSMVVRDGASSAEFSIIQDLQNLKAPERSFNFNLPAKDYESRELALEFVKETGLIRLFRRGGVKNFVDYVLGVEAGVDSNARKNRSGKSMESVVGSYLDGFVQGRNLTYIPQATPAAIKKKWGFATPIDKAGRIFDFAISDGKKLVLMEVNFYGGGGSKLKATAGEYKELNKVLVASGIDFVWVTDGRGWLTTLGPLREAFDQLDYVWNLSWLGDGLLQEVFA
jgi:type II restriction enzyme